MSAVTAELKGERARDAVVEFLDAWRYCPVSQASSSSRPCLEDAAGQLLDSLAETLSETPAPTHIGGE